MTNDELDVHVNFRVPRHPGLAIIWQVGSNQLHLMRIGGPKGSYKMQTKTHRAYRTSEGAHAAALRWFALLDKVYEPVGVKHEVEA